MRIRVEYSSLACVRALIAVAASALLGCTEVPREAFTAADQLSATLPGHADARIWADAPARDVARMIASPRLSSPGSGEINELALSGGGSGGSFAAGLLAGWSETGKRPEFDVVTGVSTGALIAPFAFLGQDYDGLLRAIYTGDEASKLASPSITEILGGSGLLDPAPLRQMIEHYATPEMLVQIAAEHRRGRRLLVVTTNLDAQRPVLWDLGAIAASGRPDALALFQDVLMASASIPAIFPPVMINAESAHGSIVEMHVDGGTSTQVYSLPDILVAELPKTAQVRRHVHLWVIVNNTLPAEFAFTSQAIVPVALRAFSTLMKSQTKGIVTASYEASLRLGIDFHLAYIDRSVKYDPSHPFDKAYRDQVYEVGKEEGESGAAWHASPDDLSNEAALGAPQSRS